MYIQKNDLLTGAAKIGISEEKALELWRCLKDTHAPQPSKFNLSHLLYYFGAAIVIIAMGWFVNSAWEHFEGKGILAIALAYILIFLSAGLYFWHRKKIKTAGGLFVTLAVCLIPLAVYGFQKWTGLWIGQDPGEYKDFVSWIRGGWFAMELATIIGGCIALRFIKFPFLTAPIFFSLWFMSMDITPLLFGNADTLNDRLWVSMGLGLAMIIIAYVVDQRIRHDFAFWGYFFGVITFWTGLTILDTPSELGKLVYCLINVVMMLLSVFLQRTVFLFFGSIGVLGYLSSLFYRHFADSIGFPIALSFLGICVIMLGILYHKNRQKIELSLLNLVPKSLKSWLPESRRDR